MAAREVVPGLRLDFTPEGDVAIFSIVDHVGLLDVSLAMDRGLGLLIGGPFRVVVDYSKAARIRKLGVGLLAYYAKIVRRKGGRLVVVAPPPGAAPDLEPFDLREMFGAVDTREEAIAAARID
jgi:anti-anti-sigma regulatory factor